MPRPAARPLTELLVEEHGALRCALALFARYAEQVVSGNHYDPRLARVFLRFFRVCGERHHDKEERVLFPWLEAHGFARDSGALVVLRTEHDLGRALRADLERTVRALLDAPGEQALRVRFHGLALRFTELLTAHMNKEEQVLFPLVGQIAARNGGHVRRAASFPPRALSWMATLEAGAADSWPRPSLSLHGLGTTSGFERLCRAALAPAGRKPAGSRGHSRPARRKMR